MPHKRIFPIRRQSEPGAAPGTMIAPLDSAFPVVDIIAYSPNGYSERSNVAQGDIPAIRAEHNVIWVNVAGLGNANLIEQIGELFNLHALAMEDVLNLHQRPKVEEFDDHLFLIACMSRPGKIIHTEQVALFLGADFVLSFQEKVGDCFDPLRQRIRQGKGRVRGQGADYLCYALLDAVVDEYFPVLEAYGESLEVLEDEVISKPDRKHIHALHDMKRQLLTLRRSIWPHREMVNAVIRDENPLIGQETRIYLRDVYDHTVQLMDIVETYREIASGLVDVYISSVSAKLNEIMKVLTIIATIFMPLGFIAGVYGMNFDRSVSFWNMPELGWRYGYLFSLVLMGAVAAGFLLYFRSQGWLGRKRSRRFRGEL